MRIVRHMYKSIQHFLYKYGLKFPQDYFTCSGRRRMVTMHFYTVVLAVAFLARLIVSQYQNEQQNRQLQLLQQQELQNHQLGQLQQLRSFDQQQQQFYPPQQQQIFYPPQQQQILYPPQQQQQFYPPQQQNLYPSQQQQQIVYPPSQQCLSSRYCPAGSFCKYGYCVRPHGKPNPWIEYQRQQEQKQVIEKLQQRQEHQQQHRLEPSSQHNINCVSSSQCAAGSACVDGNCVDCVTESRKCLRSVEQCKMLNCQQDERCFIKEDVEYYAGTAVAVVTCAKANPCRDVTCGAGYCVNRIYGDLAPTAECMGTLPGYPQTMPIPIKI